MTMLRPTNAALTALADGTARGTRAIEMRSIVIGAGRGAPGASNDDRTTLRAQRASADVTGSSAVSGRIALQTSFETATRAGFDVTEIGVMARIGATGTPFLFAYQVVDAGEVAISVAEPGVTLLIGCVLHITRSSAEVSVTVSPTLSLSVGQTRAEIDTLIGAATTSRRGLVELATLAETRAGTDGTRAVTPAHLSLIRAAVTPPVRHGDRILFTHPFPAGSVPVVLAGDSDSIPHAWSAYNADHMGFTVAFTPANRPGPWSFAYIAVLPR